MKENRHFQRKTFRIVTALDKTKKINWYFVFAMFVFRPPDIRQIKYPVVKLNVPPIFREFPTIVAKYFDSQIFGKLNLFCYVRIPDAGYPAN